MCPEEDTMVSVEDPSTSDNFDLTSSTTDPTVDITDAVEGSGTSAQGLQPGDSFQLKENCPGRDAMTLLSFEFEVKGATGLTYVITSAGGDEIAADTVRTN